MPRKKRTQGEPDPLAAAREVARAVVAQQWPELAEVEPTVTPRRRRVPDEAALRRIGAEAPAAPSETVEYTFTFAGEVRTPDGYTMPRIARVTVDSRQRVVKATTSK